MVHIDLQLEDPASVERLVSRYGMQVQAIELKAPTGGGGWINTNDLPFRDLIHEVETGYGIQISTVSGITASTSDAYIQKVSDDWAIMHVEIIS